MTITITSTLIDIQTIKDKKRWDFASYNPAYEATLKNIENSITQHCELQNIVEFFKYGASISADYIDQGILFLRVQNIRNYSVDLSDVKYISEFTPNINKYQLKAGDILITRSGVNVGNAVAISDELEGSAHSSYSIRLRPIQDKVSSEYLAIVLNSSLVKMQILTTKAQSAQSNINIVELKTLKIPLPSIKIQNKITKDLQNAFAQAQYLRIEAEAVVATAKARVERMILGEEEIGEN